MTKQPQAFAWIMEGRYGDSWRPLPGSPSSDISRRFVLMRGMQWAEKYLVCGWRDKAGKLKRRDIRCTKYVRAGK